jgi:transposase
MTRINNELRKTFIRLKKQKMKHKAIAPILNTGLKTLTNWNKILIEQGEDALLQVNQRDSSKPIEYQEKLRKIFVENPFAMNYELETICNLDKNTIQYWRKKLEFTYKKGDKKYREAKSELKKNSKKKSI